MPREVRFYVCEICQTQYKDRKKAEACEKSHCLALGIVDARYVSNAQNEKGYPTTVTVEMADGTHQIYKRG